MPDAEQEGNNPEGFSTSTLKIIKTNTSIWPELSECVQHRSITAQRLCSRIGTRSALETRANADASVVRLTCGTPL